MVILLNLLAEEVRDLEGGVWQTGAALCHQEEPGGQPGAVWPDGGG